MTSVPFTMSVYGGMAECHGLLRPEGDSLVLEYQVQDNMFGVIRGRAKAVRIPLADCAELIEPAATPCSSSDSTWSFISAISGETTSVTPGSTCAASW